MSELASGVSGLDGFHPPCYKTRLDQVWHTLEIEASESSTSSGWLMERPRIPLVIGYSLGTSSDAAPDEGMTNPI